MIWKENFYSYFKVKHTITFMIVRTSRLKLFPVKVVKGEE